MHNAMPPPAGITPVTMDLYSTHATAANGTNNPASGQGLPLTGSEPCAMCHRSKINGDHGASSGICAQCARGSSSSQGEPEQDHDSSDDYVRSLEDRVERMESLLKSAGILQEALSPVPSELDDEDPANDDRQPSQDRGYSAHPSVSSPVSRASSGPYEAACFRGSGDIEGAAVFKTHERDDSRYFGQSCSLSILSRSGIEWIKSKTGDDSFMNIIPPDSAYTSPWNHWRPDVFHDLFASQVYKPLPPRSEVFSLIKDFFRSANRLFPIYHEPAFMKLIEWQYTQQSCDDAAIWSSINIVICIAYEFRFSNRLKPEKDREKARLYFKNAISNFTELALRRTDLLSVQSLLSMGFYLRGNSGTQAAMPFITAAMLSCHRMGLHRDMDRPDLTPMEREQRRRVFWVAFTVDQSTCLRAGNAPSQHPDDFDVPLPQEMPEDRDPELSSNIPFFRQLCRMALIKTRIYCRLYTANALFKPPREIYRTVKELHAELEEWRKDYPFDEEPKRKGAEKEFLYGFAGIGLHFIYYNALIMIHRIPLVLNHLVSSREDSEGLEPISKSQAAKSGAICVKAARDTLKMVNDMPWGDIAWIWSLLYYVFLAAATLFSNIIRETRNPQVRDDLKALNMAATFFATLVPGDDSANYAGFMARMSANLERLAKLAVEKDEKRTWSVARDEEEEEEDHYAPRSKRYHPTASASHPRPHHRPPPRQPAMPSNPTSSYQPGMTTAPSNSFTPSQSHTPDLSIPETIEGLPPINSSGYVVPEGLNAMPTTTFSQPPISNLDNTAGLDTGYSNNVNPPTTANFPTTDVPSWQLAQDHTNTNFYPFEPSQPTSSKTNNTDTSPVFPDAWQVPLGADWQFGDELLSGFFPAEEIAASARAEHISFPILSAESFLNAPGADPNAAPAPNPSGLDASTAANIDYNFAPVMPQHLTQNQFQSYNHQPNQRNQEHWREGFLGLH